MVQPGLPITYIKVTSQEERHTINKGELTAITIALQQTLEAPNISILMDSSLCINSMRNYSRDPGAYNNHVHRDHLHLNDQILRSRENKGFKTHIGKVKSHIGITYNEIADKAAKTVVDETQPHTLEFKEAYHPIGGLRIWPQIRTRNIDKEDVITPLKKHLNRF